MGYELETQPVHHSSEVCVEAHNSLSAFICGYKGNTKCSNSQGFPQKETAKPENLTLASNVQMYVGKGI